jgi:hypothetical protein
MIDVVVIINIITCYLQITSMLSLLCFETGTFGAPFHHNHSNHWVTTGQLYSQFAYSHTHRITGYNLALNRTLGILATCSFALKTVISK